MAEITKKIQQYKKDAVMKIKGNLEKARDLFFVDYRGLKVEQITELRKQLYAKKARFIISKNNFSRIALKEMGMPDVEDFLFGPTAVTFVEQDCGPVAKVLVEWMRNETIKIKGGIIDQKKVGSSQVEVISNLPGKNELLSMLLSTMNAPIRNMMCAMKGVAQKLAGTLKAVADKKS